MKKLKVVWMVLLMGSVFGVKSSERVLRSKTRKFVQKEVEKQLGRPYKPHLDSPSLEAVIKKESKQISKQINSLLWTGLGIFGEESGDTIPEKYLSSKEIKSFKGAFGEDLSALHVKLNNRKLSGLPTEVKVRLVLDCALKEWPGKNDVSCIFFEAPEEVKEFFKRNFLNTLRILEDGRIFYVGPKTGLDLEASQKIEKMEDTDSIYKCVDPKEKFLKDILPDTINVEELKKSDISFQETHVLKPGDVISSCGLMERGFLDCMPGVGYGNNTCNQGQEDPTYKKPHVKKNIFLKFQDPSLLHRYPYIAYCANAYLGNRFSWLIECFIEKGKNAEKVGKISLGLDQKESIEIKGVYFDEDLKYSSQKYIQEVYKPLKGVGCGLAALNTLLLFFEHNPKLLPEKDRWILSDLSSVRGEETIGKIYSKLGFSYEWGEESKRSRFLNLENSR
jgi:hypothetical protein